MKFNLIYLFIFLCINLSLTFKTSGKIKENNLDSIYYSELVYKNQFCMIAINDTGGKVTIVSKMDYAFRLLVECKGLNFLSNCDSVIFSDLLYKRTSHLIGWPKYQEPYVVDKYKDSIYLGIPDKRILRTCIYDFHKLKDEYLSDDKKLYYIIYKLFKMRKFVRYTPVMKHFYMFN